MLFGLRIFSILLLTSILICGCGGSYSGTGTAAVGQRSLIDIVVNDTSGHPIQDVDLIFSQGDQPQGIATTNASGQASIETYFNGQEGFITSILPNGAQDQISIGNISSNILNLKVTLKISENGKIIDADVEVLSISNNKNNEESLTTPGDPVNNGNSIDGTNSGDGTTTNPPRRTGNGNDGEAGGDPSQPASTNGENAQYAEHGDISGPELSSNLSPQGSEPPADLNNPQNLSDYGQGNTGSGSGVVDNRPEYTRVPEDPTFDDSGTNTDGTSTTEPTTGSTSPSEPNVSTPTLGAL